MTHEAVPYPETITVKVGEHTETGGFHYSFMDGKYEYGYDPLWSHTVDDYQQQQTGRILYRDVTHHTVGAPYTALQGAAIGFGVGVVTGAVGVAIVEMIKNR